jgi:hypothetical protein
VCDAGSVDLWALEDLNPDLFRVKDGTTNLKPLVVGFLLQIPWSGGSTEYCSVYWTPSPDAILATFRQLFAALSLGNPDQAHYPHG